MRRLITFECEGNTLVGTLDEAAGAVGILIASGGNEVRAGAHRGMALLAQDLAAQGIPVFRHDRRGIGDSEGANGGWESSAPDLAAAAAALRREVPTLTHIVGLGNCDAATALLLFGRAAGLDSLILTNPWLGNDEAPPPPAAIRAHYARRLLQPSTWTAAIRSRRPILKLLNGLRSALRSDGEHPLSTRMAAAWSSPPATVILARSDRTAQIFRTWLGRTVAARTDVIEIDTASHSFAGEQDALAAAIVQAIRRLP